MTQHLAPTSGDRASRDAARRSSAAIPLQHQHAVTRGPMDNNTSEGPLGQAGNTTAAIELSKYELNWVYKLATPKNCRWRADDPTALTMPLNTLYAFATTFTIANLYYNQPILNKIAMDFTVNYETSSQVATLMQSGYATGLIIILPLGDMVERRPFIICLVLSTATMWIGLCMTKSFLAFRIISFICGFTTVTPQLMIPLVGDFAPAHRRGAFLSIIVSGLLLGLLIARLLSGILGNYTDWRNVYWFSCGMQFLIGSLLFCFMPDYPSTNPEGLRYFQALRSILYMLVTEPVLVQACLIVFTMSCIFTSYWTTLTFLLVSPPYEYSTLIVGLFSLLGIVAMVCVPLYGRVIDRFVPSFSIILSQIIVLIINIASICISTFSVAGPVLQAIGIDIGTQTAQVANRTAIFSINPKARNRLNTAYMTFAFAGQLTGTAVGNKLYAAGGWRWSTGSSVAFAGLSLFFSLCRGPREKGWVGWSGGWRIRSDMPAPQQNQEPEVRHSNAEMA